MEKKKYIRSSSLPDEHTPATIRLVFNNDWFCSLFAFEQDLSCIAYQMDKRWRFSEMEKFLVMFSFPFIQCVDEDKFDVKERKRVFFAVADINQRAEYRAFIIHSFLLFFSN